LDGGSAPRKASTYTGQHNTEKREHTSMTRVGFQPTISVRAAEDSKCLRPGTAIQVIIRCDSGGWQWWDT